MIFATILFVFSGTLAMEMCNGNHKRINSSLPNINECDEINTTSSISTEPQSYETYEVSHPNDYQQITPIEDIEDYDVVIVSHPNGNAYNVIPLSSSSAMTAVTHRNDINIPSLDANGQVFISYLANAIQKISAAVIISLFIGSYNKVQFGGFGVLYVLYLFGIAHSETSIAAGGSHNCYLGLENQMKCWGSNDRGQLGLGDNNTRGDGANEMGQYLLATDLGNSFNPTHIGGGLDRSCALSGDNKVKCWGWNWYGQLGYGDWINRGDHVGEMGDNLLSIDLGTSFIPTQIAIGWPHSCALSSNNTVKCWGGNFQGQLGQGDINNRGGGTNEMGDYLSTIDLGTSFDVIQITAGGYHTCALSNTYEIKCWGKNDRGQLGYGDTNNRGDATNEMGDNLLVVDLGTEFVPIQIATGDYHTCAISTTHMIKCWGRNDYGQLGYGDTNIRGDGPNEMGNNLLTVDLGTNFNVIQVVGGKHHTCALSTTSNIKCWGGNYWAQLGQGDTNNRGDNPNEMGNNLNPIDLGTNFVPIQVEAGRYHTCALSLDNTVKCWGRNDWGQLGYGDTHDRGDNINGMGDNLLVIDLFPFNPDTSSPTNDPTKQQTTYTNAGFGESKVSRRILINVLLMFFLIFS